MKHLIYFVFVVCAFFGLHSCNSNNNSNQDNDRQETCDTIEECVTNYIAKHVEDVSLDEFDTLYQGCFIGNVAGYEFTFKDYIAQNPQTMHYPFTNMQNDEEDPLHIIDSPDGKIRFYCWNAGIGGTCIAWETMYQIEHDGNVFTFNGLPDWDSESMLPTHIYKLPHKKKDYYIFIYYFREWSSLSYYAAVTYELKGEELERVNLFMDTEGTKHDRLDYEYNVPDYYFRFACAFGFGYHFYFDAKTSTLYFPLSRIKAEETLILSDRYTLYQWNGTMLTKKGEAGNPHLRKDLQNYEYIVQALRFQDSAVSLARIDVMPDGTYRYAAWENNKDMSDKPDILLFNGTADEKRYYFRNKTHTYVITRDETPILEVYNNTDSDSLGTPSLTRQSVCDDD